MNKMKIAMLTSVTLSTIAIVVLLVSFLQPTKVIDPTAIPYADWILADFSHEVQNVFQSTKYSFNISKQWIDHEEYSPATLFYVTVVFDVFDNRNFTASYWTDANKTNLHDAGMLKLFDMLSTQGLKSTTSIVPVNGTIWTATFDKIYFRGNEVD